MDRYIIFITALAIIAMILLFIVFPLMLLQSIPTPEEAQAEAEEKCERLDMKFFDNSPLVCWNPVTKETRVLE